MRIRTLKLTNFRPFEGVREFPFNSRFTVIAGINGKGKTAILDGLALLASRLMPQVAEARGGYRWATASDVHRDQPYFSAELSANCAGIPLAKFEVRYDRARGRPKVTRLSKALRREIKNAYGPDRNRANDAAPLVVYYTTDRAGYRLPKKIPRTPGVSGQAAAYGGALSNRMVNYRDFMIRYRADIEIEAEQRGANPSFIGRNAVSAVARSLETFLGGFTNLRVEENPARLLVDKGGVSLEIGQLSDGERSFIALVADLCRRLALANPELADPLQGAGVVLIDEVELHLHPRWQREIVGKLKSVFPNIQFIVTTHSPFVIQTIADTELLLLDDDLAGQWENRGIEEISFKVMGVVSPEVSPRYLQMLDAARDYFRVLENVEHAGAAERERLKQQLQALVAPYADNPAYQAFLEANRVNRFRE